MAVFGLHKPNNADGRFVFLSSHKTYSSADYAKQSYKLYLTDELDKDEHGRIFTYYRLHAMDARSPEQAMRYSICCPKCGATLRQVGRSLNYHDLGLYECPVCSAEKEGRN